MFPREGVQRSHHGRDGRVFEFHEILEERHRVGEDRGVFDVEGLRPQLGSGPLQEVEVELLLGPYSGEDLHHQRGDGRVVVAFGDVVEYGADERHAKGFVRRQDVEDVLNLFRLPCRRGVPEAGGFRRRRAQQPRPRQSQADAQHTETFE